MRAVVRLGRARDGALLNKGVKDLILIKGVNIVFHCPRSGRSDLDSPKATPLLNKGVRLSLIVH